MRPSSFYRTGCKDSHLIHSFYPACTLYVSKLLCSSIIAFPFIFALIVPILWSATFPLLYHNQNSRMTPAFVNHAPKPLYYHAEKNEEGTFTCLLQHAPIHCYTPELIRQAYTIQPLHDQGITGKGRTIVILSAYSAPNIVKDLREFNRVFKLPQADLQVLYPDGQPPFDPDDHEQRAWVGESTLDVQWAHVIAPDAKIVLVLAKSSDDVDMIRALQYTVKRDLGDVITMSFGQNEACLSSENMQAWHQAFYDASQKQMTLLAASGDTGPALATCDNRSYEVAAAFPATDPLVTAIGGSHLYLDEKTDQYRMETVWNESEAHVASGGGFSTQFARPSYQSGIGKGAQRAIPDVSFHAALNGGLLTAWSDGGSGPGEFYINGGTSAGTPQWAGIVALTNQYVGKRTGFLNLAFYFIGLTDLYTQAFHDIFTGHSSVSLLNRDNKLLNFEGYSATHGWDAATGWGTPRVAELVPTLADVLGNKGKVDPQAIAQFR